MASPRRAGRMARVAALSDWSSTLSGSLATLRSIRSSARSRSAGRFVVSQSAACVRLAQARSAGVAA